MEANPLAYFEGLRERNIMEIKKAKERGKKVVGTYCAFAPKEVILAAGAIPVSLCGTRPDPISAAERILPRNLCPLIKSSFGFAITDTCPYFYFADLLVAETTCDGKKKMYELLSKYKPLHILKLPPSAEGQNALTYWYEEILKFKDRLEREFGVKVTSDKLRQAIRLVNEERRALLEFSQLNCHDPAPLWGLDVLKVLWAKGFTLDLETNITAVHRATLVVKERIAKGIYAVPPGTPRILLTGCPVGLGSEKVITLVESGGGVVVCLESCSGIKPLEPLVEEEGDPWWAIATKYLQVPCPCLTPNRGRFTLLSRLIQEYKINGVIDLTWQACHTYNIEAYSLKKMVQEEYGVPYLQIETDYSPSDLEQLKVRIEAFLELIR
ncbi:Benzoyl-CoA reductase/2-hydroxyglutaryl-CoA dehydratase subunit, BcrC/BadD/HgdB [Thermanaeromonas toyohensis ToBE]|uniref:Benzoyl-CoA reductase/2-hydroxyglutaryl-CoA dehydratase subunit, BcrC/BadD/HgdB n=1 Tax=Thermanaeromonas toyohensis ToBE TaxID=698762 RepID=A0A1W1W150_9FIRM|nr:double-cubane-cluster-containing anaerobic reductase [Thermanaeromonas toyohensis]SMB99306.1 Benzoyl-CoA reductase/2-hydroxyglutaryl-CoA dehydratase subunit, BcrC/BadD/HgdB [Thermanaeromonas toyohensis ToBE]